MNKAYIFDVDGTLTPSRKPIDDAFVDTFVQFAQNNDVYLVSGSDYAKTVEQLGQGIVDDVVKLSYNCSGNSIWEHGLEVYRSHWVLPEEVNQYLIMTLEQNSFELKTGNHIEVRPGAVNFSIVGRNADDEARALYIQHDKMTGERQKLTDDFNLLFGERYRITATIGGETGIDITAKGCDKSQILKDFPDRPVVFFGDKCGIGGNDAPLATAIFDRKLPGDVVHHVSGWKETQNILTERR